MRICTIKNPHVQPSILQGTAGGQAAEAPTNDHDPGNRLRHPDVLLRKRGSRLLDLLHPELHEPQKNFISHLSQLIYRTTVRRLEDARRDCLFAALRPFRESAQVLPPRRDGTGKVLHEMLYASLAAGKMEEHTRPHDAPTKTGSPADRRIGIRNVDHAKVDQIHDLTIDCGLKTVRNVSHNLLSEMDRLLADRRIEFDRAANHIRRRRGATHDFH